MIKKVKYILFWVTILFVILLFKSQVDAFICNHLTLLNYEYIGTKISYIILVIIVSVLLYSKIKIHNNDYLLNSVCIIILYLIFRLDIIKHNDWDYISLFGSIKYADLLLMPLVVINRNILSKKCVTHISNNLISNNNPIESKEDDLYGYYFDANNLLKVILQNKSKAEKGAVVIGLQGGWGQGKTSYLNMMRVAASQYKNVILVRINVWMGNGYENIAKNLLNTIANSIDDLSIKMEIHDYVKAIINANISFLSKIVSSFWGYKPKQTEELFEAVSNKISNLSEILIVQVDDLDRITKDELLYTLKLIRNVAGFKNTFFIVAYDQNYINECFKSLSIKKDYLGKIFNIIYSLPITKKEQRINIIKKEMSTSLLIDADIDGIIEKFMQVINDEISLRDARRLVSCIQCDIPGLQDEDGEILVDPLDYILVQYLKLINETAYDFLSNLDPRKTRIMFYDGSIITSGMKYIMNKHNFLKKENLKDEEYKEQRLKLDIGNDNLDLSYRIFKELFDDGRDGVIRIKYINSHPLYFNGIFDKKLIGRKNFARCFNAGKEIFIDNLHIWYSSSDRFALHRLIANYRCSSVHEWITFFEAILDITPVSCVNSNLDVLSGYFMQEFIPSPGLDVINKPDNYNLDLLYKAIETFFLDKDNLRKDSLDTMWKKMTLYIVNRNTYINPSKILSDESFFKLYWSLYIEKCGKDPYSIFNENFWYLSYISMFQEKLNIRDVMCTHIKDNVNSFIKHYSAKSIVGHPYFKSLFYEYMISDDGRTSYGRVNKWLSPFISVLESIEDKSSELREYIDACKQITE